MRLQPYHAYRDSGVPWLGDVPAHWGLGHGRAAFREKKIKNTGMVESQVLSLSYGRIVVKPPEKLHGLVPESFETYQVVDPGDIIIRSTDLQNDWNSLRIGLVKDRGIITSAYICLNVNGSLTPEYAHLLLHTYDLKKIYYGMGSGLRQNLDITDFKYLPILIPPLPEQHAIARFLDHIDRRVNRYIRAKRRLIALLNEQKQAIIHRAVTRGLDPDAPLKPSGVEWLGEIPEHWDVRRLKTLVRRIDQGVSPQAENLLADDGSWGVLKAGCVNHGVFRQTEHKRLPVGFRFDPSLAIKEGDVLVSRANGSPNLVGSVGQVRSLGYRLILSDKTFRPVPNEIIADPGFIVMAMNSWYYRQQVLQAISGAEGLANNLPLSSLRAFVFAMPQVTEQRAIIRNVNHRTGGIDAAIKRASCEIDLIREYRTRLIADVVTGKLDVGRQESAWAAAAGLPEELEEIEPEAAEDEEVDFDTEPGGQWEEGIDAP